jgi:hypothetical protein
MAATPERECAGKQPNMINPWTATYEFLQVTCKHTFEDSIAFRLDRRDVSYCLRVATKNNAKSKAESAAGFGAIE